VPPGGVVRVALRERRARREKQESEEGFPHETSLTEPNSLTPGRRWEGHVEDPCPVSRISSLRETRVMKMPTAIVRRTPAPRITHRHTEPCPGAATAARPAAPIET